jgi:hypothetical protein
MCDMFSLADRLALLSGSCCLRQLLACGGDGRPRSGARGQKIAAGDAGHDVTADGDDEHWRQARDLGASEFLTKPVDFDLMREQLRRLSRAAG